MNKDEVNAVFDQQAAGYDEQWKKTAPIRAILASSDLASDVGSSEYEALLRVWFNMMAGAVGMASEGLERMRAAYAKDVAILPPARVESLLRSGGFATPVQFYQAGLIHAWFSRRASDLRGSRCPKISAAK